MTYERRASPLHAARAGAGAAWCVALGTAALAFDHPLVLGALLAVCFAAAVAAGVWRPLVRLTRFAVPFVLVIALINALVVREGLTVVARLGSFGPLGEVDVTLEGLVYGGVLGLRAYVIVLAFALMTLAVDPDQILRAFRRLSFRSGLTAALAVRLVPVLARDGRRLAEAQRLRADGGGSGTAARVAALRAVTAGALDRASDVAATLELRGFASARRAPRTTRPWSRHDAAFTVSAVALLGATVGAHVAGVADFAAYPALAAAAGRAEVVLVIGLAVVALAPFADRRGIEP